MTSEDQEIDSSMDSSVNELCAHEFTLFKKFYSKLRNLDLEKLSAHFVNKEIIDFEDKEKIFNATTVPENNIDKSFLSPSKWCYYKLVCNAGHHMPVRRHCWKRSRSTNETRVVIPSSISYGCGVFDFIHTRQTVTLQQCFEQYSVKCYISCPRNKVNDDLLWQQRSALLHHLNDGIKNACSRLTPKATKPITYIDCPFHDGVNGEPHLLLNDISLGMVCRECNDEVPFDAYYLLMEPTHLQKLRPVECAVFIDEIQKKNDKPTPRDLNRYVVTKHAVNWKEIAGELHLKPEVVSNIAADFQSFDREKHENCLKEVFLKWLKVDTGASWTKLEIALTNVTRIQQGLHPVSYMYETRSTGEQEKPTAQASIRDGIPNSSFQDSSSTDDNDSALNESKGSSQPKLAELVEHVGTSMHEKWYDLGLQLGVNDDSLDQIEDSESKSNKACRKMFQAWLRQKHDGTWNDVILALKSRSVDESNLAESLKELNSPLRHS